MLMKAEEYLNRYHKDAEAVALDDNTIVVTYHRDQDGHTSVSSYKLLNAAKRKGYEVIWIKE